MAAKRSSTSVGASPIRKLPRKKDLCGQLTARTHILHTSPDSIILELCSRESAKYILIDDFEYLQGRQKLEIGHFYVFANLRSCAILIKHEHVKCFKVTENTTWHEIESDDETCHLPSFDQLKTVKGKVTKVDEEFGTWCLNDSITIICSTASRFARIPTPKRGQQLTVYNVHPIPSERGKTLYAMCVRTFVTIECNEDESVSLRLSPLMLALGDKPRSYKIILWLQECLSTLRINFSDDFLTNNGILISACDEVRSILLQNLATCLSKRLGEYEESFLHEFMATDHNASCGAMQEMIPFSLPSLQQIFVDTPASDTDSDDISPENFWHYDVKKTNLSKPAIGVICVKSTSHRLTLSDSHCSFACMILPKENEILNAQDMIRLNKKLVIAWNYYIVKEKFHLENTSSRAFQSCKAIAFNMDDVNIISIGASSTNCDIDDLENVMMETNKPVTGTCLIPSNGASTSKMVDVSKQSTSVDETNKNISTINMRCGLSSNLCISSQKNSLLSSYKSQLIFVQTKSSISVKSPGKVRFVILASLVGNMVQVSGSSGNSARDCSTTGILFIALEGPLVAVQPIMAVNTLYEIRFPISSDEAFFKKSAVLSVLEGLKYALPTILCVILPANCEIHYVINNHVPNVNLKFKDCYGIEQAVKEVSSREFVNVIGYVMNRFHQEPKFDREKISIGVNGFGIPGPKVPAVILRDTPPQCLTGSPVTLYMTNWTSLQYPIGLVPGAKVIFRFVMKVCPGASSQGSSPYFRASVLTAVEILELPVEYSKEKNHEEESKEKELWGPRNLLCSYDHQSLDCFWISVSMAQLHRVSITAKCPACDHEFSNGVCSFAGCAAGSSPFLFSQASFVICEFGVSKTFVFVPDRLVQTLLQCSEKTWEMICRLAQSQGQLKYFQFCEPKDVSDFPLEQKIFHNFCARRLLGPRFHLLCRQFRRSEHGAAFQEPSFYAVDIAPVSSKLAKA